MHHDVALFFPPSGPVFCLAQECVGRATSSATTMITKHDSLPERVMRTDLATACLTTALDPRSLKALALTCREIYASLDIRSALKNIHWSHPMHVELRGALRMATYWYWLPFAPCTDPRYELQDSPAARQKKPNKGK